MDVEDQDYDRHHEYRERARRRMEERRNERDPRARYSRGGEEDSPYSGLDGVDMDLDEEIRRRHEDRMKDHTMSSHHRRSGRRSKIDKANAPKGIDDEGALYHLSQVTDKQNILRNRVSRGGDKFTDAQKAEIEADLAEYYKFEIEVAKNRQKMSKDYNKARDIHDKTKRRAYLDGLKEKKDDRRVQDKAARDAAREVYLRIKDKIENILNHSEL